MGDLAIPGQLMAYQRALLAGDNRGAHHPVRRNAAATSTGWWRATPTRLASASLWTDICYPSSCGRSCVVVAPAAATRWNLSHQAPAIPRSMPAIWRSSQYDSHPESGARQTICALAFLNCVAPASGYHPQQALRLPAAAVPHGKSRFCLRIASFPRIKT